MLAATDREWIAWIEKVWRRCLREARRQNCHPYPLARNASNAAIGPLKTSWSSLPETPATVPDCEDCEKFQVANPLGSVVVAA